MAFTTGSVTTFTGFVDALKTYLTSNGWTNLKDSGTPRELFFRNTANDTIIGFKVNTDNLNYYNLLMNMSDTYDASKTFYQQLNSIPNTPDNIVTTGYVAPLVTLHNNAINYWFFLNDRRLIFVAKCGTSYVSGYIGRFTAYGTPAQYPQPFFCGGNATSVTQRLSVTTDSNSAFIYNTSGYRSVMKNPNNDWLSINFGASTASIYPTKYGTSLLGRNSDNTYTAFPCLLFNDISAAGELENVFCISGVGASPENIITIAGAEYVVFNNIFRTTTGDFFAIKK